MSDDIEANTLTLLPVGAAATTISYDLSGLDGSSSDVLSLSEGISVAVDQNVGDPTYPDNVVVSRGFNIGANGARADTDKAAFSWRMERSYYLNGVDTNPIGFESHWQLDSESGALIRPLTAFAAHDGSFVGTTAQVHAFSVEHPDGPGDGQFKIDFAEGKASMDGLALLFVNNVPAALQLDSADHQIALPYIDDLDGQRVSAPIHHVTAAKVNPNGNHSYTYRAFESPANGYYGEMRLLAAGVTGTFIDRFFSGSASVNITVASTNTHSTGGLRSEQVTTAGDIVGFNRIGSAFFAVGMRATDGAWCASPSGFLDDGGLVVRQNGRCAVPSVPPASASAAGKPGDITWDSSFIYICVATDTWKRVAIATW